jgi:hypothetical protein
MSNPYQQPYGSDPYQQPQTGYSQPQGDYSQYSQPQYNQAPGYGQTGYGQPGYVQPVMVAQQQTNNNATISLILGICCYVGLGILTGIPAVIFGHKALREIDRSGGTQGGKPLAIIGLVLGYIGIVGTVLLCLFLIFVVGLFGAAAATAPH